MIIGVIGSGTMGSGIAQLAATAKHEVKLFDANQNALQNSKQKLAKLMNRLVEKGKYAEEEASAIQKRISYVGSLNDFSDCGIVIEAIIEDLGIKSKVFAELEGIVSGDCIIASNTSSLSITSLAASVSDSNRFIGIHFFNPAPLMKLVEVIPAIQTDEKMLEETKKLIASWGKVVVQAKDTPGFIVNKVARPFYGEALRIYEEGIADPATIDWAMKGIGGFRMGPFELMDFIGNDVNYAVTESVFKAFYYDSRYKPAFAQKRLAEAGYLGRKSGRGYYNYAEGAEMPKPNKDQAAGERIFERILLMLINEAADTLHMGIATAKDIDLAMTNGVNYPKGLLAWANEMGVDDVVKGIDELYKVYHEDRYRCSPILRKTTLF